MATAIWWGFFLLFPLAILSALGKRPHLTLISLSLLFFFAGAMIGPNPVPGPDLDTGACARALGERGLSPPNEDEVSRLEVEGTVRASPQLRERSTRLELAIARARAASAAEALPDGSWSRFPPFTVDLSLQRTLRPLPGDTLRAVVRLDDLPPSTPFSRRAYQRRHRRGISCVGRVEGELVAVLDQGGGLLPSIERSRRALSDMARSVLPSPTAQALVPALMVGDRSEVTPAIREAFVDSGLAHLLSVSGLHLSLAVLGIYRILRWILGLAVGHLLDAHRLAAALTLPFAPAYAAFTGGQPPVLRAAIGTGLFVLAQAIARQSDGWTSLAVAALGILAWDPASLFEPSFQLSFAACAGLLGITPMFQRLLSRDRDGPPKLWRRGWEWLVTALATTLGATIATLPLTAFYFNRFSLSSLAANVAVVPVGLLSTALCAFTGALGLLHEPAAIFVLPFAGWSTDLLATLAAWFASWPGSRIPIATPGRWEWGCVSAGIVSLFFLRRHPRLALAALASVVCLLFLPKVFGDERDELVIEFLPVGQGDATLLLLPSGEAVLVDTGGDLRGEVDLAELVLLPLLAERRVTKLRALVLSHLHPDHVASAPTLLRFLPVEEVWFTGRALEGNFGAPIAEAMEERGIPLRALAAGSAPLEVGGVRFEVLGPPDRDGLGDDPLLGDNDASLVLRVVHGAVRILLAGDIEEEGEQALVESGVALEAELLKAPHHGSRTSSTTPFLGRVRPDHVVFCVGWRNQWGFPHREVEERYLRMGVRTHRTDRGAIRFVSDGERLLAPSSAEAGALLEDRDEAAVVLP